MNFIVLYESTSAIITVLPNVDFSDDCAFTFWFRASMNEDDYQVIIEELTPGGPVTVHNSGWITGTAKRFDCLVTTTASLGVIADDYLLPDTDYKITLSTRNSCDSDQYSYDFSTTDRNCNSTGGSTGFRIANTHPNPAASSDPVTVDFILDQSEQVDAILFKVGSGGGQQSVPLSLPQNGLLAAGSHQIQFSPQDLLLRGLVAWKSVSLT